jgi:hypothetical protein
VLVVKVVVEMQRLVQEFLGLLVVLEDQALQIEAVEGVEKVKILVLLVQAVKV